MSDNITIPVNEQIAAMLSGSTGQLLEKYFGEPRFDYNSGLTVKRSDVLRYLRSSEHIGLAEHFFAKHLVERNDLHDTQRTRIDSDKFSVVTFIHGEARFVRTFETVEEAVAEFILTEHGLYN